MRRGDREEVIEEMSDFTLTFFFGVILSDSLLPGKQYHFKCACHRTSALQCKSQQQFYIGTLNTWHTVH